MLNKVTITYRGAKYEIGRGRDFYGIWTTGGPRSKPLEWWPETAEGWSAAWTRFASIEAPGAIVPVGRRTPPVGTGAVRVDENPAPFGQNAAPLGETAEPTGETVVAAGGGTAPYGQFLGPLAQNTAAYGAARRVAPVISGRTGAVAAATLLAVGVILGVAGLFPAYLGGSSLASHAYELIPHVIYLVTWTASAVLILLGGVRLRLGALLSLGLSVVTFGLFFADAGTAIAGAGNTAGAGLVLALLGWLACAAGSVAAFLHRQARKPWQAGPPRPASRTAGLAGPAARGGDRSCRDAGAGRPRGRGRVRSGVGQLHAAERGRANPVAHTGQCLLQPGPGDRRRPGRDARARRGGDRGCALASGPARCGAARRGGHPDGGPGPLGPRAGRSGPFADAVRDLTAQASQIGLTISSGLTPAFWIYCGFLVALVVSCTWMLFTPHPVTPHPAPDPSAHEGPSAHDAYDTSDAVEPDFETAPSRTAVAAGDGDSSAA